MATYAQLLADAGKAFTVTDGVLRHEGTVLSLEEAHERADAYHADFVASTAAADFDGMVLAFTRHQHANAAIMKAMRERSELRRAA